ncbi:hypothetical protein AbraIFM66951_002881 [Aspergillus brasiliensis]|nr:hypothetical protein AbraIFM66950_008422 [Aspergillus brasiliensis]GKZ50034.1 hypothetical protein AbraIFM66951_002881 [Aspergillus brasiliensis]
MTGQLGRKRRSLFTTKSSPWASPAPRALKRRCPASRRTLGVVRRTVGGSEGASFALRRVSSKEPPHKRRSDEKCAATMPMPSLNAAGHPETTSVNVSIAHGKNSTGIWMMKKLAFLPRLSWEYV